MDLNTILLVVAGLVAPVLNAVLKQPSWSSRVSWVVAALTSVGLGGIAQGIGNGITPTDLVTAATAVFAIGQAAYHLVTKHTGWNALLESLLVFRPKPVELEAALVEPEAHVSDGTDVDYTD